MSLSQQPQSAHPVVQLAAGLRARLDRLPEELADRPVSLLTAAELRGVLTDLAVARAQLDGLRLRVLAAADAADVAADTAATSTAAWLVHATRQSRAGAHADVALARALFGGPTGSEPSADHAVAADALTAGELDADQARVVVRSVDALPAHVATAVRQLAEKHLVGLGAEHDVVALRVLGRRVFEVVDPDAADELEGRRLQAEEEAAARATFLRLSDNGDGTHAGRFRIPALHAAMLAKALEAFTDPSRRDAAGTSIVADSAGTPGAAGATDAAGASRAADRRRSRPERLGTAFCELLERLPADRLPSAGGVSATVVVTLDHDRLTPGATTRPGTAGLDTGQRISAAEARRLACEAGIVPAVYRKALAGPPVVLDLGRRTRLHTEAQRLALALRDGGCTADGCDRPPGWCHAHHDVAWSAGGSTSVENGRLLCRFHHRRAHDPGYVTTRLPTGKVAFHRRT